MLARGKGVAGDCKSEGSPRQKCWPDEREADEAVQRGKGRVEMMPMPAAFDGYLELAMQISSTCLISVGPSRISLLRAGLRHDGPVQFVEA